MAGEIQLAHDTTAETLYAIVRNAVGQVWRTTTSTFVSYSSGSITDYDIALTEQGTASRYYVGDFPAAAAGIYSVTVFVRAGGSPAEGDEVAGAGAIEWDGTAVVKQTGDAFARIGAAGIGLTAVGLASTQAFSNTGTWTGTIATVTNLTNAPTSGDLTATMKTSVGTAADSAITANTLVQAIAGYLDTEIAAIKAKTDQMVFTVANQLDSNVITKTGFSLAAAGMDSVVVETGLNARQSLSIIAAALAGVLSGAATTTITIRAAGVPATTRVTATVDADGNRSALTLVPPS